MQLELFILKVKAKWGMGMPVSFVGSSVSICHVKRWHN